MTVREYTTARVRRFIGGAGSALPAPTPELLGAEGFIEGVGWHVCDGSAWRLLSDAASLRQPPTLPMHIDLPSSESTALRQFHIRGVRAVPFGELVVLIASAAALTTGVTIVGVYENGQQSDPILGYTTTLQDASGLSGGVRRRELRAISNLNNGAPGSTRHTFRFADSATRLEYQDLLVSFQASAVADRIHIFGTLRSAAL